MWIFCCLFSFSGYHSLAVLLIVFSEIQQLYRFLGPCLPSFLLSVPKVPWILSSELCVINKARMVSLAHDISLSPLGVSRYPESYLIRPPRNSLASFSRIHLVIAFITWKDAYCFIILYLVERHYNHTVCHYTKCFYFLLSRKHFESQVQK